MITLKEFLELIEYRITESVEYMWECYGPNAMIIDSWDGEQDGHTLSIIFDKKTTEVFEVTAADMGAKRVYRMINPEYADAYVEETEKRGIDLNYAWDDVKYVDLDLTEDFINKATAIIAGEKYDDRVEIELTLSTELIHTAMQLAHQEDITLNQYINNILQQVVGEQSVKDYS